MRKYVFLKRDFKLQNILFSKPSASKAEIIDALRKANAYDFVMSFPKGIKTLVGERGTQLSGILSSFEIN